MLEHSGHIVIIIARHGNGFAIGLTIIGHTRPPLVHLDNRPATLLHIDLISGQLLAILIEDDEVCDAEMAAMHSHHIILHRHFRNHGIADDHGCRLGRQFHNFCLIGKDIDGFSMC